jgi:hypothetical protein
MQTTNKTTHKRHSAPCTKSFCTSSAAAVAKTKEEALKTKANGTDGLAVRAAANDVDRGTDR